MEAFQASGFGMVYSEDPDIEELIPDENPVDTHVYIERVPDVLHHEAKFEAVVIHADDDEVSLVIPCSNEAYQAVGPRDGSLQRFGKLVVRAFDVTTSVGESLYHTSVKLNGRWSDVR